MPAQANKTQNSQFSAHQKLIKEGIECVFNQLELDHRQTKILEEGLMQVLEEAEILLELTEELREDDPFSDFAKRNRAVSRARRKNIENLKNALTKAADLSANVDLLSDEIFIRSDTSFLLGALSSSKAAQKIFPEVTLSNNDSRRADFPDLKRHLRTFKAVAAELDPQDRHFPASPSHCASQILNALVATLNNDLNSMNIPKGRPQDLVRNRLLDMLFDLHETTFGTFPPIREDGPFVDLCTGVFALIERLEPSTLAKELTQISESTLKRYVQKRRRSSQ